MILRFSLENILSFKEKMVFDMFPNPRRTMHPDHIYADNVPLLKQAMIYGANASGKSNFIKAAYFLSEFVNDDEFIDKKDMGNWFHKDMKQGDALKLEIEFKAKDNYYIYQVLVPKSLEVQEFLYESGVGRRNNKLLFKRVASDFEVNYAMNSEVLESIQTLIEKNPSSSLIALNHQFPVFKLEKIKEAISWLTSIFTVLTINYSVPSLIALLHTDKELLEFTNSLFKKIGLGILGVSVKETDYDIWRTEKDLEYPSVDDLSNNNAVSKISHSGLPESCIINDEGTKKVLELVFLHEMLEGNSEMELRAQSDGTQHILKLVPAFYQAIFKHKVIMIDEIELSIHPELILRLAQFFAESKSNGQLIYTTHQDRLMNQQELVRPDEIWFTEKIKGATRLYSLNEFKEHATKSLQNGYLQGRYGAIPDVDLNFNDVE